MEQESAVASLTRLREKGIEVTSFTTDEDYYSPSYINPSAKHNQDYYSPSYINLSAKHNQDYYSPSYINLSAKHNQEAKDGL